MVFDLNKNYKLNMTVLGKSAKAMVENDQRLKDIDFSKEMIDFVKERGK